MERIGVFICECGPNIKEALNVEEIAKYASSLAHVAFVKSHTLLCAEAGKALLKKEIIERNLSRVVIAACSPKEHESTFMKIAEEAGLNPYLVQIANIREHCAWVISDKVIATEKAKVIIRTAVSRVLLHQPIVNKEIDCTPDALVVGAGVAGIEAALVLAQKGRKVYLVEKSPNIGGRVVRYEDVFPKFECATCMLDPKLDEILHKNNIHVFTYSVVDEVLGYFGNFIIKIKKKARSVSTETCLGCGACFEACPVNVKNRYNENLNERKAIYIPFVGALPNVAVIDRKNCLHFRNKATENTEEKKCEICKANCPFGAINFDDQDEIIEIKVGSVVLATGFDSFIANKIPRSGYGKFENIYTGLEFERILSSTGPTGGEVILKNGESPKSAAIIHCVGSRSKKFHNYCSGVCCTYSLTFAHIIKKKSPNTEVFNFYSDFSLAGKGYHELYDKALEDGVNLIRTAGPDAVEVNEDAGSLVVKYKDAAGKESKLAVDMVILSTAIEPSEDATSISQLFDITLVSDGFFTEEHDKLAPVSTTTGGIFIAGCCQGPKDIQSSVAQGAAAAGKILSCLVPGEKLKLEATIAEIDEKLCSGCKICIGLCPYKAIYFDKEKKVAAINDILCKGCGICSAACPSGAVKARHFTSCEITAEIKEIMK